MAHVSLFRKLWIIEESVQVGTFAAFLSEAMLLQQKTRLFQIGQRALHCPFGKAQIGGNGSDCRKALSVFTGAVLQIHENRHSPVRQIGGVHGIKISHTNQTTRTGGFSSACFGFIGGTGSCFDGFAIVGYFLMIAAFNASALAYLTSRADFSAISYGASKVIGNNRFIRAAFIRNNIPSKKNS